MNVRFSHLRAAKVHILFLTTKFILKKFNLFPKIIHHPLSSSLHPQITGCKYTHFFSITKRKNTLFLSFYIVARKALIYCELFFMVLTY